MNAIENKAAAFSEYEIEFKDEVVLRGTLTRPEAEGRIPAALFIAGSGDTDRDGTLGAIKVKTNIYKDLAHLVAGQGLVTLRYDKRGVGKSEGDRLTFGMWDLVADVQAALVYLKNQLFVDPHKIILIGHSEGCMLATAVNARTAVDGMILISGAAETLEEASFRQRQIMYKELRAQKGLNGWLMRLINIEKLGEKQAQGFNRKVLNTQKAVIKISGRPTNAKWLREHYQFDLYADLKKVTCPVLAIAGDKDFQTDPEKAKKIGEYVQGKSEVVVIKDMDHGLKEFKGVFKALDFKKNYQEGAGKPLHPDLQKCILEWIDQNIT